MSVKFIDPILDLLPFYTILRSIPNKLMGVIGMLGAILILLAMPVLDTGRVRGSQFRPLMRVAFWILVADFFLLMHIGAQHAEEPYVTLGAAATALYFSWFLVLVPAIGIIENTLIDVARAPDTATQANLSTNSAFAPYSQAFIFAPFLVLDCPCLLASPFLTIIC